MDWRSNMEYTARMNDNAATARAAACASMVLLKNVNETLPLLKEGGEPLRTAVFGVGQLLTPLHSAAMQPWRRIGILDGLCQSGSVQPDSLLAHKYRSWVMEHPGGEEYPLDKLDLQALSVENRAALVVVARAQEAYDVQLTAEEKTLLKAVTEAFSRTVLVLAAPGFLELTDEAMACTAIVFMGIAGQEGGAALADLLTAKVMPAGRLAFAWPMRESDYARCCAVPDRFVGYRYFDSFGTELRWPFGYGQTYGKCEIGAVSAGLDGCDVVVTAEISNTGGRFPASELVQVYVSYPEAQSDQPVWILDCFKRTRLLAPGESETVQLRFSITELSRFREEASAYVLQDGFYDIRVGTSSRDTMIAGSIRVTRSAVVQAATPMKLAAEQSRVRSGEFTYPGERQELEAARKAAIRFSDRNLPRRSRKKGGEFSGCRSDGSVHTLSDVRSGACSLFQMIAAMDDVELETLADSYSALPQAKTFEISGIDRYGIPALCVCAGGEGLYLEKEERNEDDEVTVRRNLTAFPAASLLACAFDYDTIRAVGQAVWREMQEYGVDLWLAPGAQIAAKPGPMTAETWSEDPVLCGICARALLDGAKGAAVLRTAGVTETAVLSQAVCRDLYCLPFEIASGAAKVFLLPEKPVSGKTVREDGTLVRSVILDWRYRGMFLTEGKRYGTMPDRVTLEKTALRILRQVMELTE